MISLLWELFSTFFLIGLLNFGGGGAMLSLIQAQVVTRYGWLSESAFTNIVAISQSTPGPIGINCATYVGYEVMGVAGSAVATFAVVLPSFLVFFLIIKLFQRLRSSSAWANTMSALKPAVAALIAAAAAVLIVSVNWDGPQLQLQLIQDNFPDWRAWLLFGAAFVLGITRKAGPIALLLAGAVAGLIIF